jgi:hypothetical protein
MVAVVGLVLLTLPGRGSAETLAVAEPTGSGVELVIREASHDFLMIFLQQGGHRTVPLPAATGGFAESLASAQAVGAQRLVLLHLSRLGDTTRVALSVYDAGSGALIYSDQLPANGDNDLDPVLERLVRGYRTGESGSDTAQLHTVTNREAAPRRRRSYHFNIGGHVTAAVPIAPDSEVIPGLGLLVQFDTGPWFADAFIDWSADNSGIKKSQLGVGVYRPLSTGDLAPYVGGSVRYGGTQVEYRTTDGITLAASAGVILGRLSGVQVRAELGYFVDLYEVEIDGEERMQHGLLGGIGVSFGRSR